VRTREDYSTDWIQIGEAYCNETVSIRALAKRHDLSDTAIRKEAKKRGWIRPDANLPPREPECKPEREPERNRSEATARAIASTPVKVLTARGRNIILALMDELEFLNGNHQTIADMVADYINGEKDVQARAKLLKVLDHESRSKTANYLATALAKLNDAAPGKKEQAEDDAKTAGQGSGWGDDLDTGIAGRPN
jgi:transposase-like protein